MEWTTNLSQWSAVLTASYLPLVSTVQLVAGAVWVGTLLSVSWLCGRSRVMADGPELGRLAQTLHRRWSTPALVVGALGAAPWIVGGIDVTRWRWFLSALFVLGVSLVFLHVSVGRRANEIARGELVASSGGGMQRLFLVSLVVFGALVMFRSQLTH